MSFVESDETVPNDEGPGDRFRKSVEFWIVLAKACTGAVGPIRTSLHKDSDTVH
jgi:hypothetical protein